MSLFSSLMDSFLPPPAHTYFLPIRSSMGLLGLDKVLILCGLCVPCALPPSPRIAYHAATFPIPLHAFYTARTFPRVFVAYSIYYYCACAAYPSFYFTFLPFHYYFFYPFLLLLHARFTSFSPTMHFPAPALPIHNAYYYAPAFVCAGWLMYPCLLHFACLPTPTPH